MENPQIINDRHKIEGFDILEKLALNFSGLWIKNHALFQIWEALDRDLWELTRNPWAILQVVPRDKLEKILQDPAIKTIIKEVQEEYETLNKSPSWFQKTHQKSPLKQLAYFCMEFMLGEALPIYSGGLGNVAGDQLKAASDLGVPVTGIGILYQQGYFRQTIGVNGEQEAFYPFNSPSQLPIRPLRKANGEWVRLEVKLPGWPVWIRAWEVSVGRLRLILLDSNDLANYPPHRGITSELYGGGPEMRLKQELILGICGWRVLKEIGIKPDVCHLNEGHAAFATLERAADYMKEYGVPFETAFKATRSGNLFTTHTAVEAGFDRFSPDLIKQYLERYAQHELGISIDDLLALGRVNPKDQNEPFNMAYLAIHGSGAVNAVSCLHGKVSQKLFEPLFPRWPEPEVPIGYVTNGVHMASWCSREAGNLWIKHCGETLREKDPEEFKKDFSTVTDKEIWDLRNVGRKKLIEYSRPRIGRLAEARGRPHEYVEMVKHLFDPNTLTLGFARRFATYKRPDLLLYDPDRLLRILKNPTRPVQLLLAGKAHPADKPGQALIKKWAQFILRPEARAHIIFLSDYDYVITQYLVQGVDVWINNPRRPWEACGTSGMKVLVNGGLNLSELDGWWNEAYEPDVGWALGDGKEHGDDPAVDHQEAEDLYDIIENQIVPEFYNRNEEGLPTAWISRIRASMSKLTPEFNANRAVRDYTDKYYVPLAKRLHERNEDTSFSTRFINWQNSLKQHWPHMRFGELKVDNTGKDLIFEVTLYFGELDPEMTQVELFASNGDFEAPSLIKMNQVKQLAGCPQNYLYRAVISATRPATDYTPRVVSKFDGAQVPLESSYILWQR